MSRLKTSCALAIGLAIVAALSAEAAVRATHRHHPLLGPAAGVGPAYDSYPSISNGEYGASSGGGAGLGEAFGRNSGGVNSMSNDFGTSGVLGHTNGMPVIGR